MGAACAPTCLGLFSPPFLVGGVFFLLAGVGAALICGDSVDVPVVF